MYADPAKAAEELDWKAQFGLDVRMFLQRLLAWRVGGVIDLGMMCTSRSVSRVDTRSFVLFFKNCYYITTRN